MNAITAAILVVGGVERLVHIAHEVQQKFEGEQPLGRGGGRC